MIGSKIAQARKEIKMSQAQLAQQLFISPQAVGKWERGESIPDIITLNRLAEIVGVDLNFFSASFPSAPAERVTAAPSVEEPAKSPEATEDKKLSWDMSRGNWLDADFSGLKNLHEQFSSSNMQNCKFAGADLSRLLLKNNHVLNCDFSGADFSNSHIRRSHLSNNQFNACLLKEAVLSESYVSGSNFSNADFTGAVIKSGGFEKCDFANAIWDRTSFTDSQLADMVIEGPVADCVFESCKFTRVAFRNATLTNTFFKNGNLKRLLFIDCQADRITYAFLKNGGAQLNGIALLDTEA